MEEMVVRHSTIPDLLLSHPDIVSVWRENKWKKEKWEGSELK